jgi:hypothetical protein
LTASSSSSATTVKSRGNSPAKAYAPEFAVFEEGSPSVLQQSAIPYQSGEAALEDDPCLPFLPKACHE